MLITTNNKVNGYGTLNNWKYKYEEDDPRVMKLKIFIKRCQSTMQTQYYVLLNDRFIMKEGKPHPDFIFSNMKEAQAKLVASSTILKERGIETETDFRMELIQEQKDYLYAATAKSGA